MARRTRLRRLPLGRAYRLIEPGPVVLVVTAAAGEPPDAMAMSWHTMMEFEPPLVGCVISGSHLTWERLRKSRECVIAVPTVELARAVVGCGNASGRTTDKFTRFGLTALPASLVSAPLVAECWANLECRLVDEALADSYNFVVLEVVAAWIDPARKAPRMLHHRGRGEFAVDGRVLRLPSRMK
jgi:flavin reductase (DIM6/NTAB) family NADH-FMN oxidoreductase RutF